jgi:hypothetical protein
MKATLVKIAFVTFGVLLAAVVHESVSAAAFETDIDSAMLGGDGGSSDAGTKPHASPLSTQSKSDGGSDAAAH